MAILPEADVRLIKSSDGTYVYWDLGTRKGKKNRRRHIKDGAPKSMRGMPKPEYDINNWVITEGDILK